jgi:hypothetical protein
MKGGSVFIGEGGRKAINVRAPIVMRGAVSPIALDRAMMIPVMVPPTEYGKR